MQVVDELRITSFATIPSMKYRNLTNMIYDTVYSILEFYIMVFLSFIRQPSFLSLCLCNFFFFAISLSIYLSIYLSTYLFIHLVPSLAYTLSDMIDYIRIFICIFAYCEN